MLGFPARFRSQDMDAGEPLRLQPGFGGDPGWVVGCGLVAQVFVMPRVAMENRSESCGLRVTGTGRPVGDSVTAGFESDPRGSGPVTRSSVTRSPGGAQLPGSMVRVGGPAGRCLSGMRVSPVTGLDRSVELRPTWGPWCEWDVASGMCGGRVSRDRGWWRGKRGAWSEVEETGNRSRGPLGALRDGRRTSLTLARALLDVVVSEWLDRGSGSDHPGTCPWPPRPREEWCVRS